MTIISWRDSLSWRGLGTSSSGNVPVSWGVWRLCGIQLQWLTISITTGRASPLDRSRLIFSWKATKYSPISWRICQRKSKISKVIMQLSIRSKIWVLSFPWSLHCTPSLWRTDIGSRSRTWLESSLIRKVWLLPLKIFYRCIFINSRLKSTKLSRWLLKRQRLRRN